MKYNFNNQGLGRSEATNNAIPCAQGINPDGGAQVNPKLTKQRQYNQLCLSSDCLFFGSVFLFWYLHEINARH